MYIVQHVQRHYTVNMSNDTLVHMYVRTAWTHWYTCTYSEDKLVHMYSEDRLVHMYSEDTHAIHVQ